MRLNLCLALHIDDRALGIRARLAPRHGDVGALQVIQRQRIGRIVAQVGADLVQGELGRILELVIPQAECGIQHAREHGQQLLLLLGHDVHAGVLAQDVAQVGQGGHQVGLGAGLVGAGLLLGRLGLRRYSFGSFLRLCSVRFRRFCNQFLQRLFRLEKGDVLRERRHIVLLDDLDRGILRVEARAAHRLQVELGALELGLGTCLFFQRSAVLCGLFAQSCDARFLGLHIGVQCCLNPCRNVDNARA